MPKDSPKTRIEWQEARLDSVVRFYSDGFRFGDGERPLLVEYFLDPQRGKVVFKIIVETKPK